MRPVVNYLLDGNLNAYRVAKAVTQEIKRRWAQRAAGIRLANDIVGNICLASDALIPREFMKELKANGILKGRTVPHPRGLS